jgi:DNA primase
MEILDKYNLFSDNLNRNQEAIDYLISRGIKKDLFHKFNLGVCNPQDEHWFPLIKGRIVLSIKDCHDRHVAFAGRHFEPLKESMINEIWNDQYLSPKKKEDRVNKWLKGKWINESYSKSNHLYNLNNAKKAIKDKDYAIVVEGYFDAIILSSLGLENVVAVCGTNLSEVHLALIYRYTKNIILMLDSDQAGISSSEKQIKKIDEHKMNSCNILLPESLDPDEFVLEYGCEFLEDLINNSLDKGHKRVKIA